MRKLTAVFLAGVLHSTAQAQAQDLMSQVVQSSFKRMALAYMCRDAIGISHYQAARIAAEGILQTVGSSADEATLAVDELDKKFKADPRAKNPAADAGKCLEQMNEASHDLDVLLAKFRTQK